jgi:ferredoxin-NADP reductase/ferredoxin
VSGPDPAEFGWWLASRAAGVVALLCITVSVGVGLAMAGRVSRHPKLARVLLSVHQQTALVGLVAIAVHGITLFGDSFLSPSIGDIAIPFTSKHEPLWTGLGVTGGWLGAILGLSYWIRDRIGAALWRKLHRATILVYVLSVAHTLGAGTDASEPWMRLLLVTTGAPILFLFVMRVLTPRPGPRFVRYRVAEITPESRTVCSFGLVPRGRRRLPAHQPGQFVTLRADVPGNGRVLRSYSLSAAVDGRRLRISVKREAQGVMSRHLHAALDVGATVEVTGPSGAFVLGNERCRPIALVSAGIGATPVLAMLHALAANNPRREVWWIHSARNGREHPFRGEVRAIIEKLEAGHSHVRYSRPEPADVLGRDFDAEGRLTPDAILELGVPLDAEFRLCGPNRFVADLADGLRAVGVDAASIASESFGGAPATAPAAAMAPAAARQAPEPVPVGEDTGSGPSVVFARSSVSARWEGSHGNLLELAEAKSVPTTAGCRIGACQGCRTTVLDGSVRHEPEPLEAPPAGSALLCCARPEGDVVLDA